jgi:hypothetical protein
MFFSIRRFILKKNIFLYQKFWFQSSDKKFWFSKIEYEEEDDDEEEINVDGLEEDKIGSIKKRNDNVEKIMVIDEYKNKLLNCNSV